MKLGPIEIRRPGKASLEDVIGRIDASTEANAAKPKSEQGQKAYEILGGFLQPVSGSLSSERWISSRILELNREWVYRNNDVIAGEVSKMNFELFRVKLVDGEITYQEVQDHPLLNLLDKPNNEEVKSDALYIIQSHKKLTGDAFWLKIRTGRQVTALRHLPPDKITLNLRNPSPEDPTVIESFTYRDRINNEQIEVTYQPEDIIYIKKPNPNNQFRGLGAVEALFDTIEVDNLTNTTTRNFFKKGAITNFVLSTEQKITRDQLKRLRAELRQDYTGADNAYKTMILGGGLKPEKIAFSNKDMEFLSQLEWYRDKIMIGFGNTKAAIGIIDDVNRAAHENSMIEWKRVTVKPDMDAIINALNEFLVPEFGEDLVLGYTDPIPEDRSDDITEAKDLYSGNIIMRSEARELLGYETDESDNVYYQGSMSVLTPDGIMPGDDDEPIDNEVDPLDAEEDEDEDPRADDE